MPCSRVSTLTLQMLNNVRFMDPLIAGNVYLMCKKLNTRCIVPTQYPDGNTSVNPETSHDV